MVNRGHALSRDELIRTLTAYSGITTADGADDGTTLIDSNLIDNAYISPSGIPEKTILILSGDARGEDKPSSSFNNGTGAITLAGTGFSAQIMAGTIYRILNFSSAEADIAALLAALGNPTGDMRDVTQSEAASLAAYITRFKEHFRAHDQTRICLIVPDLADFANDLQNTAIKAQLDLIGSVSLLDQLGVDEGEEDWEVYDLVVVGSNAHDAFLNANLDDLIKYHGPVMVCNSAVAQYLLMGTAAGPSTSDDTEYCETIHNRVMQLVFTSLGQKVLFDSPQESDRLDMSAAALTAQVLMVDTTGEGPGLTVVGWLPAESADGETYELNDGSSLPSGRLFAGCFVHADRLTDLGKLLLRRIARNLTQAHLHPLTVQVKRVYQEDIPETDFSLALIDDDLTDPPPGADTENSIVDIDLKNGRTYVLRSLWVDVTSFGTGGTKLTFKLWVMVNTVVTEVDSVDVAVLGIQNLMDLFGLPEVHADGIWLTVQTDSDESPGDAACEGTFRYAEAKK